MQYTRISIRNSSTFPFLHTSLRCKPSASRTSSALYKLSITKTVVPINFALIFSPQYGLFGAICPFPIIKCIHTYIYIYIYWCARKRSWMVNMILFHREQKNGCLLLFPSFFVVSFEIKKLKGCFVQKTVSRHV